MFSRRGSHLHRHHAVLLPDRENTLRSLRDTVVLTILDETMPAMYSFPDGVKSLIVPGSVVSVVLLQLNLSLPRYLYGLER